MSFPSDRTKWKKPRHRAIGWQEADAIEQKLRSKVGLGHSAPKEIVQAIAAEHDTSAITIAKIAQKRGIRVAK